MSQFGPLITTGGGGGTVAVDGVTITGDGSVGDPLTAPGSDTLVLVADTYSFVEDNVGPIALFANDLPVGGWTVHEILVPSVEVGAPPVVHYPSATPIVITGRGSLVIGTDGVGTATPTLNVHGAWPVITVVARGPNGHMRYSTVAVTFTPVNDPPVARDIAGISIYDPIGNTRSPVTIDFGAAMSDPDGDAVSLTFIDATPIVYGVPIALAGGSITINALTLLGVITPGVAQLLPIVATYTVTDGTVSVVGDINIVIAEVPNLPMISPVSPHNAGYIHHAERLNFFQTFMQDDGPLWPNIGPPDGGGNLTLVTRPPYSAGQGAFVLTSQEPWLYNRVRTAYLTWVSTQDPAHLATAIEWCELYFSNVGGDGSWTVGTVDPQDPKYKYPENAELYRRMTGSSVYLPQADALYTAMRTAFPATYDGGSAELWTERNWAYALRAHMHRFYNTGGDTAVLTQATEYVDLLIAMSAATGAPLHGHNKHEGSAITTLISSPWMTGIAMEDMLQYYRHTRRVDVLEWMYNYGVWVVANALYVADHTEQPEFAGLIGLRLPAYLAGTGIQFPEGTAADMRHARDVATLLDKARWAGEQLAENVAGIVAARDEMFQASLVDDAYWTRTTPLYAWKRVNPPRSHSWMFAHFYALIFDTGLAPPIAPVVLTNGVISGSSQQGQVLTFTPGTQRGTPVPTVTWVWRLAGVDIAGTENDLTYTAGVGQLGATTVFVTLTNTAGVVTYTTNTITVVANGTPVITVQPTNQSANVGAQAVFSLTATGVPAPTYQWRRNTGGGMANATEGTGILTNTHTTEVLAAPDDADTFECVVSNVNGSVTSNVVTLSMVVQQPAVQFTDSTDFATLAVALGSAGFVGWTVAGWLRVATTVNNGVWLAVEGAAGRWAGVQWNNSGVASVGDSQTGTTGGGWNVAPPLSTWVFVVFRGLTSHPGTYEARWYDQNGVHGGTASRTSGVENSLTVAEVHLNGGSVGSGEAGVDLRAQYIRGYNRRLSDVEAAAEWNNHNLGTANLMFFDVFESNGGGGVQARDATGNGRLFVMTGATFTADGPVAGTV